MFFPVDSPTRRAIAEVGADGDHRDRRGWGCGGACGSAEMES